MKRRNFVKQSIAGAIIAATPLALTGLVRAEGGGGSGPTSTDTTDWWDTTGTTHDSTDDSSTTEEWTTTQTTSAGSNPCSIHGVKKVKVWLSGSNGVSRLYCLQIFRCFVNGAYQDRRPSNGYHEACFPPQNTNMCVNVNDGMSQSDYYALPIC